MAEAFLRPLDDSVNRNSKDIVFCRVFDEQIRLYGRTEKAVTETIRICKGRDVLKEYLAQEEAATIMFGGFDKEKQLEFLMQEERAEERVSAIRALMNNMKWTAKQAMDALGMSAADQTYYINML